MTGPPRTDWPEIDADRKAGMSYGQLFTKYGVTGGTLSARYCDKKKVKKKVKKPAIQIGDFVGFATYSDEFEGELIAFGERRTTSHRGMVRIGFVVVDEGDFCSLKSASVTSIFPLPTPEFLKRHHEDKIAAHLEIMKD